MAIGRRGILTGGAALWVGGSGIGGPAIVRAQTSSKVIVSHGFAMHGTPKYAADAGPPNYLNPNAPKGGAVKLGARGTFDSLHPFIVKSQPAAGINDGLRASRPRRPGDTIDRGGTTSGDLSAQAMRLMVMAPATCCSTGFCRTSSRTTGLKRLCAGLQVS